MSPMDMNETRRILASITAIYPAFVKDRDPDVLSRIWQQIFARAPYSLVNQALTAYIATDVKGFPPTPGALNAFILKTRQLQGLTVDEGWSILLKALSRGLYNSQEVFDALPREVKKIVRSPNTIFQWAHLGRSEINTVIASHFRQSWNAMQEKLQYEDLLPEIPAEPLLNP